MENTSPAANPLLDLTQPPRFGAILPEHAGPALEQVLAENRRALENLLAAGVLRTWDSFAQPIEDMRERLVRMWSPVSHLHAVMDSEPLRAAYNAGLPKVTSYFTELAQDERLYAGYKSIAASPGFAQLTQAQKKIVENTLRDFRLAGAELSPEKKARLLQIQKNLSVLSSRFSNNLLDATNNFVIFVENRDELLGIPEDVLQSARVAAEKQGVAGWKFTLHAPSYLPVMQYAHNRSLRERMYRAYYTRSSELDNAEWDNTPLLTEILRLRAEEAQLLGYRNYAELSLVPKMAESPEQVYKFLSDILERATPSANCELDELRQVAKFTFDIDELAPWDIPFLTEQLRSSKFGYSNDQLKAYFPVSKVLEGMLQLAENLFGLRFVREDSATWHPDVIYLKVIENNVLQGHLFFDLYARDTKHEGAWMDPAVSRCRIKEHFQVPVVYIVCDFTPPFNQVLPTLTHQEVLTLFHEFGHSLHHLMTKIDEPSVSGVHGVEWDAIEVPSQLFEQFAWEWEVLRTISSNETTGEPLPEQLYAAMRSSKNFHAARKLVSSCVYATFDLEVHMSSIPEITPVFLFRDIHRKYSKAPLSDFSFPINQLTHIFSGAYAAGLYSYEWAEVLVADIYAMFQNALNAGSPAADVVKKELFEVGGSRSMIESFSAIRDRAPDPIYYFRSLGLTKSDECTHK